MKYSSDLSELQWCKYFIIHDNNEILSCQWVSIVAACQINFFNLLLIFVTIKPSRLQHWQKQQNWFYGLLFVKERIFPRVAWKIHKFNFIVSSKESLWVQTYTHSLTKVSFTVVDWTRERERRLVAVKYFISQNYLLPHLTNNNRRANEL